MNWFKLAKLEEKGRYVWQQSWQHHISQALRSTFPLATDKQPNAIMLNPAGGYENGVHESTSGVYAQLIYGECGYYFSINPRGIEPDGWRFYVYGSRTSGGQGPKQIGNNQQEPPIYKPFEVVKTVERMILNDRDSWDNDEDQPAEPAPTPSASRSPVLQFAHKKPRVQ